MTFSDETIGKVLKLLPKYKLSPEGTIVTGELNSSKIPIHPTIATFGDAKFICQSVGSKIATISSLNFYWKAIISSIVTKVRP